HNAYHLGAIKGVPNDGLPIHSPNPPIQKHHKEKGVNHRFPELSVPGIQFRQDSGHINGSSKRVGGKDGTTIVNIKIDGLVKQFTVNTTTVQDSAGQIRDSISHILLKAVKDSVLVVRS
ncbi:MAG TPA: hypothetical protein VHA52_00190, partial [Candidatus Babeliaceae bacterium]|nr:hypothetical protein [Candidatus Babeliaceae bacterium]